MLITLRAIVFLELRSRTMWLLYPLHQQTRSLGQNKLFLSAFFLPFPETLVKYLKQRFYSVYTFSWNIQDSAMADGCYRYNCFCNVVILGRSQEW